MHELQALKDKLMAELKKYSSRTDMSASTLDVVDKLTHTIKNLCKILEDVFSGKRACLICTERGNVIVRNTGFERVLYRCGNVCIFNDLDFESVFGFYC